jgi:hypothetical protein
MGDDYLKGRRAFSPEEKRALIERVLTAWLQSPHERLSQFIANAHRSGRLAQCQLFYVEDDEFAKMLEEYAVEWKR